MPKSKSKNDAPKKLASYTIELNEKQIEKIQDYCAYHLWEPFAPDYAHYGFRNKARKVTVVAYRSGKVVISGKGTEEFVQDFIEAEVTGDPRLGYDEVHHPEWFEDHAGLDEAGKGDLFGPVVAATVIATGDTVRGWIKDGIADSKTKTDGAIVRLEKEIRKTKGVVIETAYCSMPRYNELMARPRANLNSLLAWLHARALGKALQQKEVPWGLLDQFSKQPLVQRQLKKDGVDFDLQMRTKAESDPIVAAASIIARATFLSEMDKLSEQAGVTLPKGAGKPAKTAAIKIADAEGGEGLARYAKMHFKTAYEAQGLTPPEKPNFYRR